MVIAGAGTGKTRVIVERVRWLLETKGGASRAPAATGPARSPRRRHGNPFDGPLLPEQILVLTYNVKAARELQERLDAAVGPATRARMTVSNFHSFCQRVLTEIGRRRRPAGRARTCSTASASSCCCGTSGRDLPLRLPLADWALRLGLRRVHQPGQGRAGHARRLRCLRGRRAPASSRNATATSRRAAERLEAQGNLEPAARGPRRLRRRPRERARRGRRRGRRSTDPDASTKAADREARRTIAGDGHAHGRGQFAPRTDHAHRRARRRPTWRDGAALEVLRLTELAPVYRAYEEELARRGALDFGEQIALVTRLFKTRPNVLRR